MENFAQLLVFFMGLSYSILARSTTAFFVIVIFYLNIYFSTIEIGTKKNKVSLFIFTIIYIAGLISGILFFFNTDSFITGKNKFAYIAFILLSLFSVFYYGFALLILLFKGKQRFFKLHFKIYKGKEIKGGK